MRALAFYLPQFHPVSENDEWWGKGFTEWRNVTRARPLFPGHYQPHLPADLGFYDLRLPEVREAQARMAREHGIHGFCYYHYWFNGRRILERPFNEVLASGKPDFPFCLCWANENWTRAWDGGSHHLLLKQEYNEADDLAHIRKLIPAFQDSRYIRVHGKPMFLVYRTELMPDPSGTANVWRREAEKAGLGGLYLVRVESFRNDIDPRRIGFDAATEFAPFNGLGVAPLFQRRTAAVLKMLSVLPSVFRDHLVVEYGKVASAAMGRSDVPYKRFSSVAPGWDNSPRRKSEGLILIDSTPEDYERWLRHAVNVVSTRFNDDERLVFINAWNEWAEGNHLEPDLRCGTAYLEATQRALRSRVAEGSLPDSQQSGQSNQFSPPRLLYWKMASRFRDIKRAARFFQFPLFK